MEEKWNFSDADRFYLKSLSSYYEGNLLNTLNQVKQCLAADSNHIKAKMMHSRLEQQNRAKIDGTFFPLILFSCQYTNSYKYKFINSPSKMLQIFKAIHYSRFKNSVKLLNTIQKRFTWNILIMDLCWNCCAAERQHSQKLEISVKQ